MKDLTEFQFKKFLKTIKEIEDGTTQNVDDIDIVSLIIVRDLIIQQGVNLCVHSDYNIPDGYRLATETEKSVFSFLDDLRDSGATNMFGASVYIVEEFSDIGQIESRLLLSSWMKNSRENRNYTTVLDE